MKWAGCAAEELGKQEKPEDGREKRRQEEQFEEVIAERGAEEQ